MYKKLMYWKYKNWRRNIMGNMIFLKYYSDVDYSISLDYRDIEARESFEKYIGKKIDIDLMKEMQEKYEEKLFRGTFRLSK